MFQPTLKHFILKQEVLNLYRHAIRSSRAIPSATARKETIAWVRAEFERNRYIYDVDVIEQKLASGRREIRQFLPSQPLYSTSSPSQ